MEENNKENYEVIKLEHDPLEADGKFNELENFWSTVHNLQERKQLFKKHEAPTYSFEIYNDKKGAKFFLSIPSKYKKILSKKLNAVYPYIEVSEVKKDTIVEFDEKEGFVECCELQFTSHHSLPIKMKDATPTFLNHLHNSMNHFGEDETSIVQILIKPLPENWGIRQSEVKNPKKMIHSNKFLKILSGILGFTLTGLTMLVTGGKIGSMKEVATSLSSTDDKKGSDVSKFSKPLYRVSIRIASKSTDPVMARETVRSIASSFASLDDKNTLRPIKINYSSIRERAMTNTKNNAFSVTELSQITSLPGSKVSSDSIAKGTIKMPYDRDVPEKGIVFGKYPQQNWRTVAFPMKVISKEQYNVLHKEYEKIIDNICKPRLVLGQMGTGKSEWVINYALAVIKMGVGLILIDPKNDTQQRLIESIPKEYMHLVDYIDLGDLAFPAPMNILRKRKHNDPTEVSMIVTSLINFFKKEFGKSWGFAMQQLIQMTGNAILLDEVSTLYEFQLMLTNKEYREKLIDKMENMLLDPQTKSKAMLRELVEFWKQFHSMKPKEQRGVTGSTMNKVGMFMANRLIRAIVSQRESYDFRKSGDMGRITIVNIPEGILNPENTRLLSSFINKAVWLDFQSRADISIHERYPTVWLLEEAHETVDDEFIGVLTKSRGYRLGVTLITQGLTNFDNRGMKEIRDLILTNCKNKILFRLGHQDAKIMADEMAPITQFDLMNLPDYHFYGKILLDGGRVSNTFFAKSLDMAPVNRSYDEYKENNKLSKLSIDDIEDELDQRHKFTQQINVFRSLEIEDEDNNSELDKID